jgi:hypothetical protein
VWCVNGQGEIAALLYGSYNQLRLCSPGQGEGWRPSIQESLHAG